MHSAQTYVVSLPHTARALATLASFSLLLAGCGSTYRPVISSISPVGPAGQPTKYAVAISSTGPSTPGLATFVDFSGDTTLITVAIGANPNYLILDPSGSEAYTLNGDGTANSFGVSTALIQSQVNQTTLPANAQPVSLYPQGSNNSIYIAFAGLNSIGQFSGLPPSIQQQLPTGAGTVYTVGTNGAPRAYAIVQGAAGSAGHVSAIETGTNTLSNSIPVGTTPVYGVMSADSRRAFILNKGSNNVSVINSQTNALDTNSTVTSGTIPVGVSPVWADLVPTLNELVVANAGNGTTPGTVTIVSVPLCSQSALASNPNCDPANPVDAVGFGAVVANIPVGINPVMVSVLQDGTRAYVANAGNAATGAAGSISVINLITNTVIATIPAGTSINPTDSIVHGHPTFIASTSGTPTGKVYVTSSDSRDLTVIRTDTDAVQTHITLQGTGVMVRVTAP